jgi:hypothetical protein
MLRRNSAQTSPRTLRLLCALYVKSLLLLFVLDGCGHSNAADAPVACIQISPSSSGLSASGKALHVLTIDSGLNEPNAKRQEPD